MNFEPYIKLEEKRKRWGDFMVHFDTNGFKIEFEAFPVVDAYQIDTNEHSIEYLDKDKPSDCRPFKEGKCQSYFTGMIRSSGVWDSNIYFTEEEYDGDDLKEMSELFDKIEEYCKDIITKCKKEAGI